MFMVFIEVTRDIEVSDGPQLDTYSVRVVAASEVVEYIPRQVHGAALVRLHNPDTHHIRLRDTRHFVEAVRVFVVPADEVVWTCRNCGNMIVEDILPACEAIRKAKLKKGGR